VFYVENATNLLILYQRRNFNLCIVNMAVIYKGRKSKHLILQ